MKERKRFYGDRLIRTHSTHDGNHEEVKKLCSNCPSNVVVQVREFTAGGRVKIRYYFVSQCYSPEIEQMIRNDLQHQTIPPDLILMNSCLWDLSRANFDAMETYRFGLERLFKFFREILPSTPFFWISALPVSNTAEGHSHPSHISITFDSFQEK